MLFCIPIHEMIHEHSADHDQLGQVLTRELLVLKNVIHQLELAAELLQSINKSVTFVILF